ncbi:MAG: hypothetical protein ABIQ39_14250, partial [Ilumatobacteraceae bacterium]
LGIGGSALGAALATGHSDSHYEMVRNIHLTTNLYGLVGLVIAGTLPYFVATQARLKTSTRATPRNVRLIVGWLAAMVVVAVVGFWSSHPAVAGAGLLGYAAGVLAVATILPRVRRRQVRWAGPRLLQIGAGMVWWVLATVVYAAGVIGGATDRWSALRALAIGGFGQIVVGSFAYLAPVLRAGGHERLTAGFRVTRSWAGLVAANVAAAGALAGSGWLMAAGLAVWALDGAARLVWFVMQTRVG